MENSGLFQLFAFTTHTHIHPHKTISMAIFSELSRSARCLLVLTGFEVDFSVGNSRLHSMAASQQCRQLKNNSNKRQTSPHAPLQGLVNLTAWSQSHYPSFWTFPSNCCNSYPIALQTNKHVTNTLQSYKHKTKTTPQQPSPERDNYNPSKHTVFFFFSYACHLP